MENMNELLSRTSDLLSRFRAEDEARKANYQATIAAGMQGDRVLRFAPGYLANLQANGLSKDDKAFNARLRFLACGVLDGYKLIVVEASYSRRWGYMRKRGSVERTIHAGNLVATDKVGD